jgi:CHAT domain-containing protein/tetratricopeptide (TPR) repeat protein
MTNTPARRVANCPNLGDWGLYEARLLPESRASELLEHASTCDACGMLLADMHSDLSPDEHAKMLALNSGTDAWKDTLLKQIASETKLRNPLLRYVQFHRSWLAAAAAALVVACTGLWWMYRISSPDTAFRLLSKSYSEQRPFELRIAGATHSELHGQRGATLVPTVELAEAESLIARKLREQPNDVVWLRARARAALLQWKYAEAIDSLRKAQDLRSDNSDILGDLAIAYLQRAEIESRAQDIAQAVEFLSRAIRIRPADGTLRFNRALAHERLAALRSAIDDWNEFLRLEPSGGWANEAREHRARIEEQLRTQAARAKTTDRSEDVISSLVLSGLSDNASLDTKTIADDLFGHHDDPWMREFIARSTPSSNRRAIQVLADAVNKTSIGDATAAVALSREAAAVFRNAHNLPGVVFAEFEQAYALQRLSKPECLTLAQSTLLQAHTRRYRWLEIQSQLTTASCLEAQGHTELAYLADIKAQAVANDSGYQTLALRSLGFRASLLRRVGSYRESIKLSMEGLRRYWDGTGDNLRAYQFYYDLAMDMSALKHGQSAAALMREAVALASIQPDRYVEGMVRANYGDLLVQEGRIGDAINEFDDSARLFQRLPASPSSQLYQAFAEISRATLDGQRGLAARGLERLKHMESMLSSIHNSVVESRLWRAKSELLTRMGRLEESDVCLRRILELSSTSSAAATRAGDPSALGGQVSEAVRILVDRSLQQGDYVGALRLWASYNTSFRTIHVWPADAVKLVYAQLPSGPVVWIVDGSGVSFRRLTISDDDLSSSATIFRRQLSTPHGSIEPVQSVARRLYKALVSPVQQSIGSTATLYISADRVFASIPFGALVSDDGGWFADKHRIIYCPPLTGARTAPVEASTTAPHLTAVASGDAAEVLQIVFPSIPDIKRDVESAARAFPDHEVFTGQASSSVALLRALSRATVFHFSGHAVVTAGDAALVLAPETNNKDRLLWASRLPHEFFQHCRLVVLAACSTGRAPDDDSDSSSMMARSFLLGGIPEVVASRWDVESRSTSVLIDRFYQGLQRGESTELSLSRAMQTLRQDIRFGHPYYWAAFDIFRG